MRGPQRFAARTGDQDGLARGGFAPIQNIARENPRMAGSDAASRFTVHPNVVQDSSLAARRPGTNQFRLRGDKLAAMTLRIFAAATVFTLALLSLPVCAQLATPAGNRGVVMGHLHLVVHDVDAQRKFWVAFGGTPLKNGSLDLIEFPGVFIMLRQGEPTAGTVGSVVKSISASTRGTQPNRRRNGRRRG